MSNKKLVLSSITGVLCFLFSCKKDNIPTTSIPADLQDIYSVKSLTAPGGGQIFVSPFSNTNSNGALMILDEKGNVLQQKVTMSMPFNFKKWIVNGSIRYTFFVDNPSIFHIPNIGQSTGYVEITDSNFNELNRVHLQSYSGIITGGVDLDLHDFILIDDNHFYTQSYYQVKVSNIPDSLHPAANVSVVTPVIQEIQNGAVVWQWLGADHPEFYANSVEDNNFFDTTAVHDYMHMNSMVIDPKDNNLICSYRNQNQVIKIDHQTGNILWRLGGKNSDFALTSDQQFLRQHDATIEDDGQTIMLFDNGEATERPYSRIVEATIDETAKTLKNYSAYNIPEPFTAYTGSVQRNGDIYFIGGGTANYVLEVNYKTGEKLLELSGTLPTYRAFKYYGN